MRKDKATQIQSNLKILIIKVLEIIRKYFSTILSIYAAIVCTLWLCPSIPRLLNNEELQFDYIGAIIGILSLLVTLLLGWNIYQVIDLKNVEAKLREKYDEKIRCAMVTMYMRGRSY